MRRPGNESAWSFGMRVLPAMVARERTFAERGSTHSRMIGAERMNSGIVSSYHAWRYRQNLRRIRETFALLGYPLDAMTDEDIERNAVAFGEAWSKDTLTFEQAEACIERLRQTEDEIGARLERIWPSAEATDS